MIWDVTEQPLQRVWFGMKFENGHKRKTETRIDGATTTESLCSIVVS
jgi:hypothetical protein